MNYGLVFSYNSQTQEISLISGSPIYKNSFALHTLTLLAELVTGNVITAVFTRDGAAIGEQLTMHKVANEDKYTLTIPDAVVSVSGTVAVAFSIKMPIVVGGETTYQILTTGNVTFTVNATEAQSPVETINLTEAENLQDQINVMDETVTRLDESQPYIGENGNWYVYDVGAEEMEDSGIPAMGDDGNGFYTLSISYGTTDEEFLLEYVTLPTGRSLQVDDLLLDTSGKVFRVTATSIVGASEYGEMEYIQDLHGEQGVQGPVGPGVPSGGTQGQFLAKKSSTYYDSEWQNLPEASNSAKGIIQIATDGDASTGTDESKAVNTKQLKAAIDGLGTVFDLKGSKTDADELPTTGNTIGDVWYVTDEQVAYIWLEDTNGNTHWEQFGAPIDLSGYVETDDIVDSLLSGATDKPLSANQGFVLNQSKIPLTAIVDTVGGTQDQVLSGIAGQTIATHLNNLDQSYNNLNTVKEAKANKVTTMSADSTDVQYPSAKCVYDYVASAITAAIIDSWEEGY